MDLLGVVQAINVLLGFMREAGASWQGLQARINLAHSQGREFGLEDLRGFAAAADLDRAQAREVQAGGGLPGLETEPADDGEGVEPPADDSRDPELPPGMP